MSEDDGRDPMLDIYILETCNLIEQLEEIILESEKEKDYKNSIDTIFRIMHTIKGNSAMMLFDNIAHLAHSLEDLFDYLRDNSELNVDYQAITDLILQSIDFIKNQLVKIENNETADGNPKELVSDIRNQLEIIVSVNPQESKENKKESINEEHHCYVSSVKDSNEMLKKESQDKLDIRYEVVIFFKEGCGMENIRAFTVIHKLKNLAYDIVYFPEDIVVNNETEEIIREDGFRIIFSTKKDLKEIKKFFNATAFLKKVTVNPVSKEEPYSKIENIQEDKNSLEVKSCKERQVSPKNYTNSPESQGKHNMLNVSVEKLDMLMDLMGELVISEVMVTNNPDIASLNLESFKKASTHLRKIIDNLQDVVMSIRMVPLASTFKKMNRIVRDMSKKLGKEVELILVGEETEVDKNIIEHIGDPLMHIIRNSLDHGIEAPEDRIASGKNSIGKIMLQAENSGGDVNIVIKDDGKGLNKEKILMRAKEHGLIDKSEEELTDKEIYSFIFLPGFSTKEQVSEFSGRGVGMDVVLKGIEKVRGKVYVDSVEGSGTTITIKIPLTLAIIDGMTIRVGQSIYTIPIMSIKQSFKVKGKSIFKDIDGNEMIMVRGQCYNILRLHERYNIKTDVKDIEKGILVMVENEGKSICIFADELLGEQQVVVKPLPNYIKKVKGIGGCNLLGDGSISLILDIGGLIL
ncbi:chemotaxis protein CheA [Clostridium homopropionicum DSM 5847]|uniref:Chemotaxis protein CheA n=1 Tax=Clostridium homopropionicum DSM 5847 TaxID=1121318 RepID=A0A0L6Z5R3_9CLOT|nr:chemotaxis protein CheA [Clostridium homopropionicum]KOA18158.1 chemotaxis protein CheA [Clostridium homopropionicum DSM 5847]SFG94814.1 two-component system, chemotaxis family, sensor kinase CheA [Clostridium homopropionicum]